MLSVLSPLAGHILRAVRPLRPGTVVLIGIAMVGALAGVLIALTGLSGLYLCGSLACCALIVHDFRIGAVLLIVLMPISGSYVFPHAMLGVTGLNPVNLLLLATLASYLLQAAFGRGVQGFLPRPLLWLYIVPIVLAGVLGARHVASIPSAFYAHKLVDFVDAGGYIRDLLVKPLLMVLFALLLGAAVARSAKPERFLIPIVISMWVMGLMAIVFYGISTMPLDELAGSQSRQFFSGLGLHANELGRLYAVAYALLLFTWAQSGRPGLRLALLASMALVAVALVLTFSRGAFVGFVIVNALFLIWNRNTRTLVFIVVLAGILWFALPEAVYHRVTAGFGGGWNAISAGRIEGLWLPLVPDLLASPVLGNGLGSILWSGAMLKGGGVTIIGATHPHNAYLEALLDMGIVGLTLLCAYFAHVWKRLRVASVDERQSPELRGLMRGAAAGLLALLITGVADSSLTPKPEQVFLWLAIGVMYGLHARQRQPWT